MTGRPSLSRNIAAIVLAGLLLQVAGCVSRRPAPAEPYRKEHPPDVARAIDAARGFDHRPYEFIWDPRPAPRVPLIDFDRLIDWTVDVPEGDEASFERSQDEQLWGAYTARFRYAKGAAPGESIQVRPPRPMPVRSRFDCIDLWVYGIGPGCGPVAPDRGPSLSLLMRDADDVSFTLPLGSLAWGGWELIHKRLTEEELKSIRQPCHFEGFLFDHLPAEEEGVVYLDSLSLYAEQLAPLILDPLSSRNVDAWPGISHGLHRGAERLSFPVDESTIVPPSPGEAWQTRISEAGPHIYDFVAEGEGQHLRYRLNLNEDERGLSIYWNEVGVGSLLQGGGMVGREFAGGRLMLARVEQDRVRAEFERGAVYAFGLQGRSLVVDAYFRQGEADGFDLGRYDGPLRYTALELPGLAAGSGAWAEVGVLTGGTDLGLPPLFIGGAVDWYRSEASAVVSGADGTGSFIRTVYRPLTSGERNDVYERAVFTVSPRIEEVLPRISNPPGKRAGRLRKKIWVDSDDPRDYGLALQASRELAGYGIREVVQGYHESCWQDRHESCTYRTRAAPGRGGDQGLQALIEDQKDLGWWPGLPASCVEIHALSPFWSPDVVQRTPENEWKRTPHGHYAVKTPVAVGLRARVAETVAEKFKPSFSYVKDAAAAPPWQMTDYDARVPGAGTFAQAFYSLGELLLAEGDTFDGPVIAKGGAECFYAGLVDGYLAPRIAGLENPYLPVFYLTRLNPLACGFGVGPFEPMADLADADRFIDVLLAAQIAYGRAGRLAPGSVGTELQCRSYFMMQELQSRYLLQAPLRIAYWDGETLVSTSEALTGGALTRSQLYLQYPGDLEIWVNGSPDLDWNVRVGRTTWLLPPRGWVASGPGFLTASVLVDGARLDYVKTTDFMYYDGRGRTTPFQGWSSSGPIAVWFHLDAAPPMIEVLDIGGTGRFSYMTDGKDVVGVEVLDLEQRAQGTANFTMENGRIDIIGPVGPHLYRITSSEEGS